MNPAAGVLLALLAPTRLERLSLEDAIKREKALRPDWVKELPGGQLPAKMSEKYSDSAKHQVATLRRAIARGLWRGLAPVLVGLVGGLLLAAGLGPPPKLAVYVLEIVGAATILAGTTTNAGRAIETYDRCTLPERLNDELLPGLAMIGTTILVLGYAWDL